MSSLQDILNTGRQALQVHQLAMQVIGQNTSNVNTEGYTRRRLELTSAPPYDVSGLWQLGGGVDVESLGRVRDRMIDDQYRRADSAASYWSQRDETLGQVETIFSELGSAPISTELQQFWSSWQDLANNPEGMSARSALVQKAQSLASGVQRAYNNLSTERTNVDNQIATDVAEVNSITSRIARINVQIVRSEVDHTEASDLRDERDRLVDRLSSLMDISIQENSTGSVNIYNGGQILVQVDQSIALEVSKSSNNGLLSTTVTYGPGGRTLNLQNGEIKGLMDLRDKDLGKVMGQLDQFAVALANRVNEVHRTGFGLTDTNGIEFFAADVTGAANFRVASLILDDPARIATSTVPDATGNNSLALQIAGIQNEKLLDSGRSTLDDFYRNTVTRLGADKAYAADQLSVEKAALDHLEARRQAVSGVSMDEEMTHLISVQQAYQAAAKIISTVDSMTQTVLSMGAGS
jgi:flagellar hook-associated protein 1 FlgK